jgi:hypothetical protein
MHTFDLHNTRQVQRHTGNVPHRPQAHLLMRDLAHGKVLRATAPKVQATHRRCWQHGKGLCELDACLGMDVHEVPHGGLLSVVGLGRVAWGWTDALY